MQTGYSVGLAFLPDDGSDPDQVDVTEIPWPMNCPTPQEGDTFMWQGNGYHVVDVQFTVCDGHGSDVFMVHVLLLLGDDETMHLHEAPLPLGTELPLP